MPFSFFKARLVYVQYLNGYTIDRLKQFAVFFFVVGLISNGSVGVAQQITPEILSQIQSLPRSQQEALARQAGIDINQLDQLQGNKKESSTLGRRGEPLTQEIYFDDFYFGGEGQDKESIEDISTAERFGLHLFDAEVSTFAPTDDALVSDDYRLGLGDEVLIQLLGTENDQYSLTVGRNGQINFPKLGAITLAGLSFNDAKELIVERVSKQFIGVTALVSIGRLRAMNVFIAGEVKVPGTFSVSAMTTVTQALFVAGGPSEIGSLRDIQVRRNGETVVRFDTYDLLLYGNSQNDIRLQSGDVVFVPPYKNLVEVSGALKRPAAYEVLGTETVGDLVSMAGGYAARAYLESAVLERFNRGQSLPELKNINLSQKSNLAVLLQDGDLLRVPVAADRFRNAVILEGSVVRPGAYAWALNQRVSDLIQGLQTDLLRGVDLGYALIIRTKNEKLDIEVLQLDLGDAVSNPGGESDLELQIDDRVLVFSLPEFEQDVGFRGEDDEDNSPDAAAGNDGRFAQDDFPYIDQSRERSIGFDGYRKNDDDYSYNQRPSVAYSDASHKKDRSDRKREYEDIEDFSRSKLLGPVIAQLKSQARNGEPVQIISISGAVKSPGTYPLPNVDNYNLNDIIKAAGGLKDSAFLESAEVRRITESNDGRALTQYIEVPLYNLSATNNSFAVKSRDHLAVRDIPDWNPTKSIEITGEVLFPGEYLISDGETLSQVIRRAGGLTNEAFASGAVFTREEIARLEKERAAELATSVKATLMSSLLTEEEKDTSFEDVELITRELNNYEGIGRLLINIDAALGGDESEDFVVVDGDALHIPERSNTIAVIGEVRKPASHSYRTGSNTKSYVALSAGATIRADEDSLYIVKANGSVITPKNNRWKFNYNASHLNPGDTIVVPINGRYKQRLPVWRDITQILYQGGIALAAVLAL